MEIILNFILPFLSLLMVVAFGFRYFVKQKEYSFVNISIFILFIIFLIVDLYITFNKI